MRGNARTPTKVTELMNHRAGLLVLAATLLGQSYVAFVNPPEDWVSFGVLCLVVNVVVYVVVAHQIPRRGQRPSR